jgi:phospholipid/cholesterol/gamma-HCH transport system permease protein
VQSTVISPRAALKSIGGFFALCGDALVQLLTRRFEWREFLDQVAFLARVSFLPAVLVVIPLCGFTVFLLNQLFIQIGAIDLAGAGTGLAVIRELAPVSDVLVVAGAGGTAICADLGARTIREEIDAMRVMGINPMHRLVVPRVCAATVVALVLNGIVAVAGLVTGFVFSVTVQGAAPGQFVNVLTLLSAGNDFWLSETKAAVFGLLAGLVACYKGLSVGPGPKAVGEAVNQTVILSFVLLLLFNSLATSVFRQFGLVTGA